MQILYYRSYLIAIIHNSGKNRKIHFTDIFIMMVFIMSYQPFIDISHQQDLI